MPAKSTIFFSEGEVSARSLFMNDMDRVARYIAETNGNLPDTHIQTEMRGDRVFMRAEGPRSWAAASFSGVWGEARYDAECTRLLNEAEL